MSKINYVIPSRSFEIVRNRIAEILVDELEHQYYLTSNEDINATVFVERSNAIDPSEMPLVNVSLARGSYDNQHIAFTDGTYPFHIDVYTKSPTTEEGSGDSLANFKLQKLIGIISAILNDTQYVTLGFERPFIERTTITEFNIAEPSRTDKENTAMGRIVFTVRVPENVEKLDANLIAGYDTQVKLGLTDKGYIFSGNNIPVPPVTKGTVTVNDEVYGTVGVGETINVEVVDTNGVPTGQLIYNQWVVPAVEPCADALALLLDSAGDPISSTSIASGSSKNIIAPDGVANLKDTAGTLLSSTNVKSNSSKDIVAPNSSAVLKDTAGNTLSTTALKSNETKNVIAPDSIAVLKDSSGVIISSTSLKSNESKDILAPDGDIENSDLSYSNSVKSNGSLVLPDMNLSNSDGSYDVDYPSVKDVISPDITVTDQDGDTSSYPSIKDLDIRNYKSGIAYQTDLYTGQTTSFRTGDDANIAASGKFKITPPLYPSAFARIDYDAAIPFFSLTSNNFFGNTNRFTNDLGGAYNDNSDSSTANYVVDNLTKRGWYFVKVGGVNYSWNNAIDSALALTVGSYTGFYLPNRRELESILYNEGGSNSIFKWTGIGLTGTSSLWSSTTMPTTTTKAYRATSDGFSLFEGFISGDLKTPSTGQTYYWIACRIHTF